MSCRFVYKVYACAIVTARQLTYLLTHFYEDVYYVPRILRVIDRRLCNQAASNSLSQSFIPYRQKKNHTLRHQALKVDFVG
jgi:hypothetical protein